MPLSCVNVSYLKTYLYFYRKNTHNIISFCISDVITLTSPDFNPTTMVSVLGHESMHDISHENL